MSYDRRVKLTPPRTSYEKSKSTVSKNNDFVSNKIREIEPLIKVVPETLTFKVKNSKFERLKDFEGFLIAEVSGPKKGPSVELKERPDTGPRICPSAMVWKGYATLKERLGRTNLSWKR